MYIVIIENRTGGHIRGYEQTVKEFDTKEKLTDYLTTSKPHGTIRIFEAEEVEYSINVSLKKKSTSDYPDIAYQ